MTKMIFIYNRDDDFHKIAGTMVKFVTNTAQKILYFNNL